MTTIYDECMLLKKNNTELDDQLYEKIKYFKGGSNEYLKSLNLFKCIEKIKPKSCIEVGCNNGLYTFGVSKLCPAAGIDYDKDAINEANMLNKKFNRNCNFVHLNLLDEQSMNQTHGQNGAYGTIIERLKSDMLIAPAIA